MTELPSDHSLPLGFLFSAATAGIKSSGRADLALIHAPEGAAAAALFTKNRVVAAPVIVGRQSLAKSRGQVRAVVVNSGNANCATGAAGIQACMEVCAHAAEALKSAPTNIIPSSTGIIGVPLPATKIVSALPSLLGAQTATQQGLQQFARAIMTTDTRPKIASATFGSGHRAVSLVGIAKGAGMIHPQLATMLVYLLTDIDATPAQLRAALRASCDDSFNCISIDGDTSTNDTVLLLASGKSGVRLNSATSKSFAAALARVCQSLAEQVVSDGEGVKHVIRLVIEKAKDRTEALHVAKAIAHSPLVKTAWAGADPNWGRILAAVGACGVPVITEKIEIEIGNQTVFRGGAVPFDEHQAHRALSQPQCEIRVRLGRGRNSLRFLTSDLTTEYVHINADYST